MNAGAFGGEFKDIVITTKYMDYEGNIHEINNQQHEFSYRSSIFEKREWIILQTVLKLKKGNKQEIKRKMDELKEKRMATQPYDKPNAGSTFKRCDDFITAKAIDEAGLKGFQIGDAKVSEKHAGFVINNRKCDSKRYITIGRIYSTYHL